MFSKWKDFWQSRQGTTAIEYSLIAAGISVAIVVAMHSIGTSTSGRYNYVSDKLG